MARADGPRREGRGILPQAGTSRVAPEGGEIRRFQRLGRGKGMTVARAAPTPGTARRVIIPPTALRGSSATSATRKGQRSGPYGPADRADAASRTGTRRSSATSARRGGLTARWSWTTATSRTARRAAARSARGQLRRIRLAMPVSVPHPQRTGRCRVAGAASVRLARAPAAAPAVRPAPARLRRAGQWLPARSRRRARVRPQERPAGLKGRGRRRRQLQERPAARQGRWGRRSPPTRRQWTQSLRGTRGEGEWPWAQPRRSWSYQWRLSQAAPWGTLRR